MANPMLGRWFGLYTKQTRSEAALEPAIAALARPYRFNHPVTHLQGGWIFPDFVLLHDRVIIEVDGESHDSDEARVADAERTKRLNADGWTVVRCRNDEAQGNPWATVNKLMIQAGLPYRVEPPEGWVPLRPEAPTHEKERRRAGRAAPRSPRKAPARPGPRPGAGD